MSNAKHNTLLALLLLASAACGGGSSNKADTTAVATPTETAVPVEQELPTADTILSRAIEVTGGTAAYEAVKSYKIVGTLSIPAQKIEGAMKVVGASGNRLVLEVVIPGIGTERSGSDGTTVWSMSAMTGSRILEGSERDRTLRDADLLKDLNWKTYYKSATTTGVDDVDGKPAYTVEMVDQYDASETRYYDQESGLLVKQQGVVESQMGKMNTSTSLKNYEEFGGLRMPSVVEVEVMGMKQIMTTTSIEINPAIEEGTFALPKDIQQLAAGAK